MKKTLAIMLALIMVLAMVPALADIGVSVSELKTGTKGEAVEVTSTLDKVNKLINVEVTITSAAKDDITVVLNNAFVDVFNKVNFMPGTKWTANVTINNASGKTFEYNGLDVGTLQMKLNYPTGFKGYDGWELDLTQVAAIAFTHPAIKKLFSTEKPTNEQLIGMYETLEGKGFTGDTALSDYILAYYREKYNNSDLTWDTLISDHFVDVCKDFSISGNASFINTPTDEELALFKQSKLDDYLIQIDKFWQVKWPEERLAVLAYDLFYKDFFAVLFGKEAADANPNASGCNLTRKRGVGDYANEEGEAYQAANEYLSKLGEDGKLENGETAIFNMALTLDGPYVGNHYACYDFIGSFSLKLKFRQAYTEVKVKKEWDDAENKDGKRPDSVTVYLLKDGDRSGDFVTLSNENRWTAVFNLPENDDQEIKYTVEEVPIEGYESKVTGDAEKGYTITNTYVSVVPSEPTIPPYTPHWHPDPTPVPVVVIPPKTGDMTIWQSILHFFGIR